MLIIYSEYQLKPGRLWMKNIKYWLCDSPLRYASKFLEVVQEALASKAMRTVFRLDEKYRPTLVPKEMKFKSLTNEQIMLHL